MALARWEAPGSGARALGSDIPGDFKLKAGPVERVQKFRPSTVYSEYHEARNPWFCQPRKAWKGRQLAMQSATKTQLQLQKQMITDLQHQMHNWGAWWSLH